MLRAIVTIGAFGGWEGILEAPSLSGWVLLYIGGHFGGSLPLWHVTMFL